MSTVVTGSSPAVRLSAEWVLRRGPWSMRVNRRSFLVGLLCLIAAILLAGYSLTVGESALPLSEVWAALTGNAAEGTARIVLEWRLPRVLLALVGGAALALSGGVFQTLTGNPLGSPDIIGFNTGAYTGALLAGVIFGAGSTGTIFGALIGGLLTGVIVYVLAARHGLQGYRLIVIGIAVSAMLAAVNSYILISVRLEAAISAAVWGSGSLNIARWVDVFPTLMMTALCLPILMALSRSSHLLAFGADTAIGRGVNVRLLRALLLLIGVLLTATVTAVAGPIAFISLVAPQIAVRLTRTAGIPLLPTAFLGAALLVLSDLLARTVIAPAQLPVGTVTVVLGGAYLVWMLLSRLRKA